MFHRRISPSPWFSAACAAAIVHRNHFIRLYQHNKSSESKVKFRQASNCCKRVFEAAKLAYATKTKESISLPRNLALGTFGKLLTVFSTKVNLLYLLYSTDWRCCLLHLIKQNYLLKTFPRTQVSLPVFPSRTNLKLHNISITRKMVSKVITNLDSSKASGPDCIPVVVLKNCEPEFSYILAKCFNKCLKESCFSKVITNLDSSKASGPDCIPVVVLKNCESEFSYILAKCFNKCLKESCFPDCWKVSSVAPVFKNVGESSTAKNYHPVSLLSMVSKVFEKLVNNRIVHHLEKCGLFSDFQYGFRSS